MFENPGMEHRRMNDSEIYSAFINTLSGGLMLCDDHGRILLCSSQGFPDGCKTHAGRHISECMPPERIEPLTRLLDQVRGKQKAGACSIPAMKSGETIPWTVSVSPLISRGQCLGMSVHFQRGATAAAGEREETLNEDPAVRNRYLEQTVSRLQCELDMREKAEIELRRSAERCHELFEKNHAMIAILDPETGAILDVNSATAEFYGYPRSMAPKLFNWDISTTPKDKLLELLGQAAAGKLNKWKATHRIASGDLRWVEMFLSPFQFEGRTLLQVIILDITEKKRAQETLRRNEEFLQAILDNTSIIVFVKCLDGKYLYINKAYERAFDVSLLTMLATRDENLFPSDVVDTVTRNDALVINRRTPMEFEETVPSQGVMRTYLSVKVPLCDMDGQPYALCGVATDITDLKRTEEQLRDERANLEHRVSERTRELEEAKRALEKDVAWRRDVEQTLRQSKQALQTLSRSLISAQEDERRKLSREVHDIMGQYLTWFNIEFECLKRRYPEAGEQIAGFIQRGREFSDVMRKICYGLHPVLLDRFGLSASLEDYAREYEARTGIHVNSSIVQVDKGQLSPETALCVFRILQESLTNVSRHAGPCRVRVRLEANGARLALTVCDDGRGFHPEPLGQGLGLFGMKERAEASKGSLTIRSAPGEGTKITLDVPM